jgi:hypothetical protein
MIAFNKENSDYGKPERINKALEKLEKLLNDLHGSELEIEEDDYMDVDVSDLISLVYEVLFQEGYVYINLSIKKNENNSLSLKVESIK